MKKNMKYNSKLFALVSLFCFINPVYSKDLILITHNQNEQMANKIIKIIEEKFLIPRELIKLKKSHRPCQQGNSSIFHFCIDKRKNMRVLKKNPMFYAENLKVFRKLKKTSLGE